LILPAPTSTIVSVAAKGYGNSFVAVVLNAGQSE
jgi:hypothetical protein